MKWKSWNPTLEEEKYVLPFTNVCIYRGQEKMFCGDLSTNRIQAIRKESRNSDIPINVIGEHGNVMMVGHKGHLYPVSSDEYFTDDELYEPYLVDDDSRVITPTKLGRLFE